MKFIRNILISLILLQFIIACTKTEGPLQSVKIVLFSDSGVIAKRASEIMTREITERCGANVSAEGEADLTVELALETGIGTEGFKISDGEKGAIRIAGNDERGLLYGVGKFLHTSRYDQGGFTPGSWRGTDVPKGDMRGIYFATHFNNWYEAASDEERQRYIESLALWGTNSLVVHYPDQWLKGLDDTKAKAWIKKMKRLMVDAKAVGIRVGLLQCVNAGYTTAPKELRAVTGSHHCWGNMLCPGKPEAHKLLLKNWEELLDEFADPGLDLITYWPFDEGGCACSKCMPWGSNGYLKLCRDFSAIVRNKFPNAKIILSTWYFDVFPEGVTVEFKEDGEYAGLAKFLAEDKSWVDYLMTDAHENFPDYPIKKGVPGDLPMVNFSEISMIGQYPWGGFGANPLPNRFQGLWNQAKEKLCGGFPYSEGIFEDMNKTICTRLYWAPDSSTLKTVKEYIAYEFSPLVVDSVAKAIQLLEYNHMRKLIVNKKEPDKGIDKVICGGSRIEFLNTDKTSLKEVDKIKLQKTSEEAFRLIDQADKQLTPQAKTGWRWRILYLRALIDKELVRSDGWFEGSALKAAFEELTKISHSENGLTAIHVPKIDNPNIKYNQ